MAPATRIDADNGTRDEVDFFGRGSSRMFGAIHLPPGEARSAVLICSPFQSEFLANYRREVLLARALASLGMAVGRFHYRGTGHSDGDGADVDFDSMREDALEAADWVRERAAVDRLGFLGTRWGALIAASVASQFRGAPLALWDPATEGARYFREVFRMHKMSRLSDGDGASQVDHIQAIMQTGSTDIVGFPIHRAFYEGAVERDLIEELGSDPRPIFLVQVELRQDIKAEYVGIVDRWRSAGFEVEVHLAHGQEAWWFPGVRWQEDAVAKRQERIHAATGEWFAGRLRADVGGA